MGGGKKNMVDTRMTFISKCLILVLSEKFKIINWYATQKMKFSITDFSVNVTKSAGNCGFGHIY